MWGSRARAGLFVLCGDGGDGGGWERARAGNQVARKKLADHTLHMFAFIVLQMRAIDDAGCRADRRRRAGRRHFEKNR
jgi:hypothetical protein